MTSVDIRLLIDAIVRQTTVLIAQIATSGGARAPLAHVANQVFVDLAKSLHAVGVSRRVGADMFGLALRTYQRKLRRGEESKTFQGRSLWQEILSTLSPAEGSRSFTQTELLSRFSSDDPEIVKAILNDLAESGLAFRTGSGVSVRFRGVEKNDVDPSEAPDARADLVLALVFREGPLDREDLQARLGLDAELLDTVLDDLLKAGSLTLSAGAYSAPNLVFPIDEGRGWEAAVFDHYASVVRTICARLGEHESPAGSQTGGSTYTHEVWPGHPYEEEVLNTLKEFRNRNTALREKVQRWNESHPGPANATRVTCYAGQHAVEVPWSPKTEHQGDES